MPQEREVLFLLTMESFDALIVVDLDGIVQDRSRVCAAKVASFCSGRSGVTVGVTFSEAFGVPDRTEGDPAPRMTTHSIHNGSDENPLAG